MILKTIGSVITIASGTVIGLDYAHKLIVRVNFLESYLKFINFVEGEIRYSVDSVCNIVSKYNSPGTLNKLLSLCKKEMDCEKSFPSSWALAIDKVACNFSLPKCDIELIKDFGAGLGISDIDTQITHCQLHKNFIKERLHSAREDKKNKSKLYVMLGIASSVTLVLILI